MRRDATTPRKVSAPQRLRRWSRRSAGRATDRLRSSFPTSTLTLTSTDGQGRAGAVSGRGGGGGGDAPAASRRPFGRAGDWAELLRISALFTVPGDALAGAAAVGARPNGKTLAAIGASLCLYEAGMALNDWADHDEDAVERPHRPLPSGRIPPGAALAAASALTAAGLGLAARAGRPALTVAGLLAGTVWAYDLKLKHTPAGPAAMATARGLDLLLGAVASGAGSGSGSGAGTAFGTGGESGTGRGAPARERGALGSVRRALPSSAVLAAHTFAVTTVSRREAQGGSTTTPLAALAATAALGRLVISGRGAGAGAGAGVDGAGSAGTGAVATGPGAGAGAVATGPGAGADAVATGPGAGAGVAGSAAAGAVTVPWVRDVRLSPHQLLGAVYVATAARPLLHAALNPSPQLTQRAVGGGIRAMIPLQAALAARAGSLGTALTTAALAPIARRLARKVSAT